MKIAIYSPYLDTFGGGEKYMMTIAEILSLSNAVDVLLDQNLRDLGAQFLKNNLSKRFDLNLKAVNFINAPIGKNTSSLARAFFLKSYDRLFYLTDGSIFFPTARRNILHIQSPLLGEVSKNRWGKFKLKGWELIIYNSEFTKQNSENNWPLKSVVIYPPVDVGKIKPLVKKKYILSVGRFFGFLKDKKHQLLIEVFGELYKENKLKDWTLYLVGSAGRGDENYLNELRSKANGLPVIFYPNLDYDNLVKLYGESSIYWHAAGFKESDPIKMEHFGISTVEAMTAGCVPVVINQGGQREIVEHGKSGFLWDNIAELKNFTLDLIKSTPLRERMIREASDKSKHFSKEQFSQNIFKLVNENK